MNILILNWRDVLHPKSGGAELVTMEHAKGWVSVGHRVTWLTAGYPGAKSDNTVDGVHFVRRAGTYTVYIYAWMYLILNARLVDVIVDEVHGFPFFSPLFTRKPVVVFIHEIAGEIWDFMFPFPKNIIGKFLEKWYFSLYKHCQFWTDAPSTINELVERGIKRNQCVAIPCPVIHPQKIAGKKQKTPTFLFVSRVVRMKGIEEIIKAFSFIIRALPKSQLWIAGSGDLTYVENLKHMLKEYSVEKNTTFYGEVPERKKYELMSEAHILLHASVKEGWGLVVLEAALVGTPAIVYNVPGLRDVVKNNISGIVVSDNTPIEMAKSAIRLIGDHKEYARLQKGGREWVASLRWSDATAQSLRVIMRSYNADTVRRFKNSI